MTTLLITHPACIDHDPGTYHPECPARLKAILAALEGPEFRALERVVAPRAEDRHLMLAHPAWFVNRILGAIPPQGRDYLDGDTVVSPGSGEAALRAAGAIVAAVDAVVAGKAKNAFCAVRPPGHHAEPDRAMGFCLFNNIAVGAFHARVEHGLGRVAVMDFDVHHGNGTQAMFERDPDLFYASTHQYPLYPGTGARHERGCGNIVNVPLHGHCSGREFRAAVSAEILPALDAFKPDLVMISAGFDAHKNDPLASLQLDEDDFAWITGELAAIAQRHAKGRIVSTLEGGYDLAALAASAAIHVRTLIEAAAAPS